MKLAVFAYSRQGRELALRVREALCGPEYVCRCWAARSCAGGEFAPIEPPLSGFCGPIFSWADAIVSVGAAGIAVRAVAPHIRDKRTDPAVLCVDDGGRFVIPLLSGHLGGANALAERLAAALGAVAVITTATDCSGRFSADGWAARNGLFLSDLDAAKAVSAAILEGTVPLRCDFPVEGELPPGVESGCSGPLGVYVSWRDVRPFDRTLLLVPPVLHLGLGCRRGTDADTLGRVVDSVLAEQKIHPKAVKCAATINLKRDEPGLLAFCERRGWPLSFYTAGELAALEGEFTPSERVLRVTGVDNVCERAAMVGAEGLLARKTALDGVTVAAAAERWAARF